MGTVLLQYRTLLLADYLTTTTTSTGGSADTEAFLASLSKRDRLRLYDSVKVSAVVVVVVVVVVDLVVVVVVVVMLRMGFQQRLAYILLLIAP